MMMRRQVSRPIEMRKGRGSALVAALKAMGATVAPIHGSTKHLSHKMRTKIKKHAPPHGHVYRNLQQI